MIKVFLNSLFIGIMYSTNKYEEHIHKINSMFLDLVTIPEIAKLL